MRTVFSRLSVAIVSFLILAAGASGCGDTSTQQTTNVLPGICGDDVDLTGTEYVQNSNFKEGTNSWQNVETSQIGTDRVQAESDNSCGSIVTFTREGSNAATGLTGIQQPVTLEKSFVTSLKLQMVMKIDYQQLTADGLLGGETPVFVTIDYENAEGDQSSWSHGFLAEGSQVNYPGRDQTITPSFWYQYNLNDVFGVIPAATRITAITVGGNGQDFRSSLALVSLRGKS